MTTQPTNGRSEVRTRRDATAGGGPPVTGDHFAGDTEGTIMRAFLRAGGFEQGRGAAATDHRDLLQLQ